MGTPELRRLLRLLLRQHSGSGAVTPAALGPAAEALALELRSTAEAAVSAAEAGGGQRPAELAAAAAAAASVDSFSPEVGDHSQLLVCDLAVGSCSCVPTAHDNSRPMTCDAADGARVGRRVVAVLRAAVSKWGHI